nr:Ubiquitin-like modifier-activating enzyme [Ipomoea batatas]
MAKKRKSLTMSLDEVDRTMYSSFCSAANSLSQLYTQSMNQQKLSFQAGEREGLVFMRSLVLADTYPIGFLSAMLSLRNFSILDPEEKFGNLSHGYT